MLFKHTRRSLAFAASLLLFAIAGTAEAQWKFETYPDYTDVLNRLYREYRVEREGCTPKLAKKPDGWWLLFEGYESMEAQHLLWSYAKRKYVDTDLPKLERGEASTEREKWADSDWTAAYYRACPYYGYRGWFIDVIKEYGDSKDLPEYIRYGMARAYSGAARARLDDLGAEAPPGHVFLSTPSDKLEFSELQAYLELFHTGCAWFSELAMDDPSFTTHVGEITLKRDNEYVTGYMDLLMAGEPDAAMKVLPPDAYEPLYRALAKNYLASCDSNAILFTNGDNDTYPLWYMQAVEGHRRDVLVLNLSLLNAPRYIAAMREGHLGSLPADWLLTADFYNDDASGFAALGDGSDTLALVEAIERLPSSKPMGRHGAELSLPGSHFSLEGPEGKRIAWDVRKKYVLRSTIAVLDLLAHHATHRPIHWAVTTGPETHAGLFDHMALQGLTYKLMFDEPVRAIVPGTPSRVNIEQSAALFLETFDWSLEGSPALNKRRFITNYVLQMSNTVEKLAESGDTLKAGEVLDRCIALFPNERWPYHRIMIKPIEAYRSIGEEARADSLARILIHELKTEPTREEVLYPVDDMEEMEMRKLVLERVRTVAEEHQREDLVKEIDALPAAWPEPLVIHARWPGLPKP